MIMYCEIVYGQILISGSERRLQKLFYAIYIIHAIMQVTTEYTKLLVFIFVNNN